MREVLVITPDFPPDAGGIQLLVHQIVSNLNIHRATVVAPRAKGDVSFDRSQPYKVVRVPTGRTKVLRVAALNAAAVAIGSVTRPDVVLAAHIVGGPAALVLRRTLGSPFVQYVHAQEANRRPHLAARMLTSADAVIVVSGHTRGLALGLGADPAVIRVVHPGVELPPFPASPAKCHASIIVVARLEERYKGHDVLLRALPLVRSEVPDVHLHIVGDGDLRQHLESLATAIGIRDSVTFHGRVSDDIRNDLLSEACIFAMPSRVDAQGAGEGFGIVYLEASARGLPVVAGSVAGAIDAVIDGKTGLLVDPEDHISLAAGLAMLLKNEDRRAAMGLAGREFAASFSWASAAQQVDEVLASVVVR